MAKHRGTTDDRHSVVADLNREWVYLSEEADQVTVWVGRHPVLAGCRTLGEVLAAVSRDPDPVLGALIRESLGGSVSAARTVLQAMLGKVVLMAQTDPAAGVHDYIAAMWERIRTYPINRRPAHIAANLALDARKLARREKRGAALASPWPPGAGFAEVVDRQWVRDGVDHNRDIAMLTVGDVIRAALELELIDDDSGNLLRTVYGKGLTSREAASQHRLTSSTVRWRCSRAVRILADHSAELAGTA
jgi:DNA-directed RNA polymerase specialized sigma24 family protein